jgi:PAS domain S-box-containing protein
MGNQEKDIKPDSREDEYENLPVSPGALYIVDGNWTIVDVGCDTAEWWLARNINAVGTRLWDLIPEAMHFPYRAILDKALAEHQPARFVNTTHFLKTSLEVNALPVSGGGLAILFVDISERKYQEETLAYQAYLFSEISEAVISTGFDFCINSWNRAAELIYGWTAAEVIGKNADTIFKAEFVSIPAAKAVETLRRNGRIEIEVIHKRKDGSKLNVLSKITQLYDKNGHPNGTVGINRDISEQKKQQAALIKSRQHDKMLAELTSRLLECENIEIILHDICRSVMLCLDLDVYMSFLTDIENNQFDLHSYSGLPEQELEMAKWVSFGLDISGIAATKKTRVVRGDIGGTHRLKTAVPAPEGLLVYICYPMISKGRIIGTLSFGSRRRGFLTDDEFSFLNVISNDIAIAMSRIAASNALTESEERSLMLVEKLKAADRNKNEFLNSLSHELRNPLATIVAGLSLLEVTDKAGEREVMGALKSQIGQLCRLVDDLLDLTRMTNNKIKLKLERIDIRTLIQSSVKAHQALFDEIGIRLEAEIEDQPLYADGDTARLMQIIGNLLHNAQKYTDSGGTVSVRACEDAGRVLIVVRDTGIGIAPEFLPSLFEPFMQGDLAFDRLNSGLGLGLSIVKGIVEMHGGTVSAESDGLGKGAAFTISLPSSNLSQPGERT